MPAEREVAGMRCGEVLEQLSDYVDDQLTPVERARIESHLRGCDWCERFGGTFAGLISAVRRELGSSEPLDSSVHDMLMARLQREMVRDRES